MIVNDDTVQKALQYLAADPHPIALALKDVTDAKNALDLFHATEWGKQNGGTIADREAAIERMPEYQTAKRTLAEEEMELARHKARIKAAEMILEIWRTENANARAAERIR